jgi:deazaflavin-dependent oxidoreductase (nitroreductase family)
MTIGSAPPAGDRATDAALGSQQRAPWLPPRWLIRTIWVGHRAIHRFSGGRRGLQTPRAGKWGTLRLVTIGRQSGRERSAILGYLEDGPNLFTLAMNGWGAADPAWWLNLQANPDVTVELRNGMRVVRAHAAHGDERERLWARFRAQREWGKDVDAFALHRSGGTAVVVFEPRPSGS